MRIIYCGGLNYQPTAPDHLGIKQGFSMLKWDWHVVDPILGDPSGEAVAEEINKLRPDIVIHGNTDSLTKSVCPRVDKGITQVFWMLDYRAPNVLIDESMWNHWMKAKGHIDYVFVSSRDHLSMWSEGLDCPAFFAPHACLIPTPTRIEYHKKFDCDLLFIGSRSSNVFFQDRVRLLDAIGKQVPITWVNEQNNDKRNQVWTDMSKYYGSAKVVLDVSHFWNASGYCSGRYWYTATFGGCAVAKRFPRCEEFFSDGMKWYFDSPEEAVAIIRRLLKDPDERNKTRVRVATHAWRNHNYAIRFQQMVRAMETGKDQI